MVDCDVAIIGGGPGGYVAAIRAAQLGLNTVCIEMDKTLGGTCVNVGCIPSKALLTSSEHYEFARLHAAEHGVTIGDVKLDLATMMKRKDAVVGQNTKGIEYLFRKNKITWAKGRGTLKKGNVVDVAGTDGKTESYRAKNVIIATGSVPVELPFLKFDENPIRLDLGTGDFSPYANFESLLPENLVGFLDDLFVVARKDRGHQLDNRHFRPESSPDRAELEADHSAAYHQQVLGYARND